MLQLLLNQAGQPAVLQTDQPPSVYLDHWALRTISSDVALAAEFVRVLQQRGGTLQISWLNLAEFMSVSVPESATAAEALVESLLPNVFCIEVNPFTVIAAENSLIAGALRRPPHADSGFADAFAHLRPATPRPFTARGLFTAAQSNPSDQLRSLSSVIVHQLESLRQQTQSGGPLRQSVLRLPSGPAIQHGTRVLLRELSRTFLLDAGMKITHNHAIDLLHAVVPTAYADFVLLDKHWHTQVERARVRLAKAGLTIPVAKVFSAKQNGIARFFKALAEG